MLTLSQRVNVLTNEKEYQWLHYCQDLQQETLDCHLNLSQLKALNDAIGYCLQTIEMGIANDHAKFALFIEGLEHLQDKTSLTCDDFYNKLNVRINWQDLEDAFLNTFKTLWQLLHDQQSANRQPILVLGGSNVVEANNSISVISASVVKGYLKSIEYVVNIGAHFDAAVSKREANRVNVPEPVVAPPVAVVNQTTNIDNRDVDDIINGRSGDQGMQALLDATLAIIDLEVNDPEEARREYLRYRANGGMMGQCSIQ